MRLFLELIAAVLVFIVSMVILVSARQEFLPTSIVAFVLVIFTGWLLLSLLRKRKNR